MRHQKVFFPLYKKGTAYTNPDGSSWDALVPDDPGYDEQFVFAFMEGKHGLCRMPHRTEEWIVITCDYSINTDRGNTLPFVTAYAPGKRDWDSVRRVFQQETGVSLPGRWQDVRLTE